MCLQNSPGYTGSVKEIFPKSFICMFLNGHQIWYENIFFQSSQDQGGDLSKVNKYNRHNKHFKLVPSAYSLDRNHLEPQKYNVISGENAQVHKNAFLASLPPAWFDLYAQIILRNCTRIWTAHQHYLNNLFVYAFVRSANVFDMV